MTQIHKVGWRKYIMIIDTDNEEFIHKLQKELKKILGFFGKFMIISRTY